MEAPEKIYLCPSDLAGIDYDEEWLEYPFGDISIEYTRTDALIDKACEWLETHAADYEQSAGTCDSWYSTSELVDAFRKHMKEQQ